MNDEEYRSYITSVFDRFARFYNPFIVLLRLGALHRKAVEMSGAREGDRILDVCTGTGAVALEFAGRCDKVVGVDLSAGMLAVAQEEDKEDRVRFLRMDATRLAFVDKSFDVSAISLGLHEMPLKASEEALRELGRVTKRRIIIIDYNPPRNPILRAIYIAVISLYESKYFPDFAREDFKGLLARCGLEVEVEKLTWLRLLQICICRPGT
jgi:ubiquinone/menaquinone biosynthesis C-methylase UbiE